MTVRTSPALFMVCSIVALVFGLGQPAAAAPITLSSGLSSFPTATFGGSGIPTDAVAVTTIVDGVNTITLALTATERYSNPPLTNDGLNTFYAEAGGDTLDGQPTYAKWNWDWYVSIDNNDGAAYVVSLLYDLDPGFDTDAGSLGNITFPTVTSDLLAQNSWNDGMGFLFYAPGFDPSAAGQYSFALILSRADATFAPAPATVLGSVGINVEVVPEPASLLLLGGGLVGVAARLRRRRIS